jgi:anti-sigma regulatory factor (Ser/Thr protein kinase)
MQPHQAGLTNGRRGSLTEPDSARSEREGLQATCRRQAHLIDTLSEAVLALRSGAAALKAENADLRAADGRIRNRGSGRRRASNGTGDGDMHEPLALDARAPAAARIVVADALRGRVAASVLADVQLVMSELVTNSVRHSAASAGGVVVRVQLTGTMVRLEVEDLGRGGVPAPRPPDLKGGGGFGLNLVQALSERWGLEHVLAGGTRVWAQLPRAPLTAPAPTEPSDFATDAQSPRDANPTSGRAAAAPRRPPADGAPMTELHVIPDDRSTWRVYDADAAAPLSEHTNATEAERAARVHAQDRDADRVVVHDRYNRPHDAAPVPAGVSPR